MDKTVRALTGLSAVDDQLFEREGLIGGLALVLEERRAALRKVIPAVFLAAYDALGRVGRRPVVVQVRGAHCGGCYMRLPPQLDSSIRRRQSLCPCPHCRRLLYASSGSADNGDGTESKHETGGRVVDDVRKSRRGRGNSGKRRAHQEAGASKL